MMRIPTSLLASSLMILFLQGCAHAPTAEEKRADEMAELKAGFREAVLESLKKKGTAPTPTEVEVTAMDTRPDGRVDLTYVLSFTEKSGESAATTATSARKSRPTRPAPGTAKAGKPEAEPEKVTQRREAHAVLEKRPDTRDGAGAKGAWTLVELKPVSQDLDFQPGSVIQKKK